MIDYDDDLLVRAVYGFPPVHWFWQVQDGPRRHIVTTEAQVNALLLRSPDAIATRFRIPADDSCVPPRNPVDLPGDAVSEEASGMAGA